jgi:hypothetical protein
MTKKSIIDYAHLFSLALKEGSPVPRHPQTAKEWAAAIDESDSPAPIGALESLCEAGEHVRTAFKRRKNDTLGVVDSLDAANCDAQLIFKERPLATPPNVHAAMSHLETHWARPDGEEIVTALDKMRCSTQLASGFFYRWRWPRGERPEVIQTWLDVRKEWHRELRQKLQSAREFLDSPLLCTKAAIRHERGYSGPLPTWASQWWPEWEKVRGTAQPETEAVWLNTFMLEDAANWLSENTGIVWYVHDEFGRALAKATKTQFYGPGAEAAEAILSETGKRNIVASIRAQGTGKNLQMFNRQLVANLPQNGGEWQQMLGRTHRPGQGAQEVHTWVYRHCHVYRDALTRAQANAEYVRQTEGGLPKLLQAKYEFNTM